MTMRSQMFQSKYVETVNPYGRFMSAGNTSIEISKRGRFALLKTLGSHIWTKSDINELIKALETLHGEME